MTGPSNGFEGLLGDLLKAMGGTPAAAWFDAAKALAVSVVADERPSWSRVASLAKSLPRCCS